MPTKRKSIHIYASDDELDALDAVRRDLRSPPSRAKTAHLLLRRALQDHLWSKENANVAAA
jgi:hypothetical protein